MAPATTHHTTTPTPWGKVPRDVMTDKRLTIGARAVYAYLTTLADGRTGCLGGVSERDVATAMGLSPGSVHRHMVALRELGHVLVETPGGACRAAVLRLGWGCPQARATARERTLWTVA
jgi:hypothetical protein